MFLTVLNICTEMSTDWEIDAYEGMGTIVKYWLPLIWEDV